MSNDVVMLKKLSTAKIIGKVEKPKEPTTLYTVAGIATGFRHGQGQLGDFFEFSGQFKCITPAGKVYASSKAFFPDLITDPLITALSEPGVDSLEFAFEISVLPSTAPIGYEYACKPIIAAKETDALTSVLEKVPAFKTQHALGDGKKK